MRALGGESQGELGQPLKVYCWLLPEALKREGDRIAKDISSAAINKFAALRGASSSKAL